MDQTEAMRLADAFLARSGHPYELPLAIDVDRVRASDGLLIAPYNSVRYLASRDPREMQLDCWPILVDLRSGEVRFGLLEERDLWRKSPGG
ncbi:hypothetical protein ACFYPN_09255 [Streptomyces sp. NPDC005576]|uniref:hypothetical protein n=1 Tax=unclassified Streptomyces TaxID=2593676 RepID=UPI0033DCFF82